MQTGSGSHGSNGEAVPDDMADEIRKTILGSVERIVKRDGGDDIYIQATINSYGYNMPFNKGKACFAAVIANSSDGENSSSGQTAVEPSRPYAARSAKLFYI